MALLSLQPFVAVALMAFVLLGLLIAMIVVCLIVAVLHGGDLPKQPVRDWYFD